MEKMLTSRRIGEDRESLLEGLESVAEELRDSYYPSQRTSTFPVLDGAEAQEGFLCSPTAVLESIGLRIPAALAERLKRSTVPPPPSEAKAAVASEEGGEFEESPRVTHVNVRAPEVSASAAVESRPAIAPAAPASAPVAAVKQNATEAAPVEKPATKSRRRNPKKKQP